MIPTLRALLDANLESRPDAVAFVEDGRDVTYAAFERLCRRAAAWLAAHDIGPGDRVAVWLVNRTEWLALLFGLARRGAALVAVNTRFRTAELEHILQRSGAKMLVYQPRFRNTDFGAIVKAAHPAAMRSVQQLAVPEAGEWPDADTPDRGSADAVLALFTTSGTTSGPKLVMHPQRTLAFHSLRAAKAYGFDQPGARLLGALPLCGVFGLNSTLAALAGGAPTVLMEAFDAGPAVELLRRHAITHAFGADEMFRRLLNLAPGHDPFPSARMFGYATFQAGGKALAEAAWARRVPLYGLYGSSEVQALFAAQPASAPLAERIEAGGCPAAASQAEVRIRDVDGGKLLPAGQSGEIEIRSPGNFAGYWNDPQASAKAIGADGFFRTGDIGRLRADGSFVFEARRGDAMRLSGFLVSPLEIEDAVKRIPGVADAQVVAVEIGGQPRCVAFVIPAAGETLSESQMISTLGGRLAAFKVPARVWLVERFPTTESANGLKVQRGKLREMALQKL